METRLKDEIEVPKQSSFIYSRLKDKQKETSIECGSSQTLEFNFERAKNGSGWSSNIPILGKSGKDGELRSPFDAKSLVTKLREKVLSAEEALKLKILQAEKYEEELELMHENILEVDCRNEKLRAIFEEKLSSLRVEGDVPPKSLLCTLDSLNNLVRSLADELNQLKAKLSQTVVQGKAKMSIAYEQKVRRQTAGSSLRSALKETQEELNRVSELLAGRQSIESSFRDSREQRRFLIFNLQKLRKLVKACCQQTKERESIKAEVERRYQGKKMEMCSFIAKLPVLASEKKLLSIELDQCKQQLTETQRKLVARTVRAGRAEARLNRLCRYLRKFEKLKSFADDLCSGRQSKELPTGKLEKQKKVKKTTAKRQERCFGAIVSNHACLTGRSLCPRRAYIESLKKSYQL